MTAPRFRRPRVSGGLLTVTLFGRYFWLRLRP